MITVSRLLALTPWFVKPGNRSARLARCATGVVLVGIGLRGALEPR